MAKTIHNTEKIDTYIRINVLSEQHIFYEVQDLGNFDMIIGMSGLRKVNATIKTKIFELQYTKKTNETIERINYIINEEVETDYKNVVHRMMKENDANETLPYNTKVLATIRTEDEEPVWSKQYPYPMSAHNFVTKEISKLLEKGIIRPSQSPYNSPIWVVPKKGYNEDGTPKQRLVIDYKKLNTKTIFDRYPMPDTTMILSNLGKAKYFSIIDLEAGYHQIMIEESDKEKTGFSINGAKYEFNRMPFGLKNAPSIFQRAIDDVLREFIGKFVYVYIDDVLVFSDTEKDHTEHLELVMRALRDANMKMSDEKSQFYMKKIEYLGHIITNGRIKVDSKKVETINEYPLPKTLRQLRSFLGLSGYYRKFIKNYAAVAKPLTLHLRDGNGNISARKSPNIEINLDQTAIDAFNKIKEKLKEQVELFQPDYSKPFELTTDASNYALGAVLSQNNKPIIFISRTLNETEQNYAANEKEALAIVWSLQHLRNYIYGVADLTIYTDHQPLTFAISEKNPNLKIKRWKTMIEESGAKVVYKPGKQNVVADALSRQYCNALEVNQSDSESETSGGTVHSRQSSPRNTIPRTAEPLNVYQTQIIFERSAQNMTEHNSIFPKYLRYIIKYSNNESAVTQLKHVLNERNINALCLRPEDEVDLIPKIKETYPNVKFLITPNRVRDVTDKNEQIFLMTNEHNRAHRGPKENYLQLKRKYFWPILKKNIEAHIKKCEICLKNKYDRHPSLQEIGETPTPKCVGEMLHMDIFHIERKRYLTCIDKFSKFLHIYAFETGTEIPTIIEQILITYPNCTNVTTDNEALFTSQTVNSLLRDYGIAHYRTPIGHSTTNGQVERAHSTILELVRALAEQRSESITEVIFRAVREYNNSIHSVTKQKPSEIFHNSSDFPNVRELIKKAQEQTLKFQNQNRTKKTFEPGEKIFVKTNRRNKTVPKYTKHTVKINKKNTVITSRNKEIHKDNIRK